MVSCLGGRMNKSKILHKILIFANKIFPKKKIILFNSYPAYSDNSRALYEYIINNRKDISSKYKIIWAQEKNAAIPEEMKKFNNNVVLKKSFIGILTFLKAKYVFSTHGYFTGVTSSHGQLQVNLWHGCGYKAMTDADRMYRGDLTVVTSKLYVPLHEKIFDMAPGTVYATGLPRNDLLFTKKAVMKKVGINKEEYNKVYIWMPTYRKANEGHDEIDGNMDGFTISTMSLENLNLLNGKLSELNILLIVKPHPMDSMSFDKIQCFSNLKIITNSDILKADIQLYELMAETDGLISDYSSVVIDYLLLQKPIAMVMSDIDEYGETRGFLFENIGDYLPGPIISNEKELIEYFSNLEKTNLEWSEKRDELSKLFHDNMDGNSCERVCNLIFEKL